MTHRRTQQGFALALTLFIILILATVCFAALSVSNLDSRTARQDHDAARALYAARAGLAHALSQLAFDYSWASGSGSLGEEGYTVTVTPAASNATSNKKVWKVTSVGTYQGASRTVEAYVELESFAKFAYFTDAELTASNSPIRFSALDRLTGAVHTNGYFTFSGHAQFSSTVTSANNNDTKFNAGNFTYNQAGTQTSPSKFYRYDNSYSQDGPTALDDSPNFSFAGGQAQIPLPSDTGLIQSNATESFLRSSPNTKRPLTRIQFQSDGTAKVYTKNSSGSGYTLVDTVQTDTAPGVTIFVQGQVEVFGTVKGRVTLGADEYPGKTPPADISIIGDLVYDNPDSDVLGMVAENDIIVKSPTNVEQDRYIHATMMALHSFRVDQYNSGSFRGNLRVFGGIIQDTRGPVGTGSVAQINTGYAKDYQYDEKLVNKPPLNFPTTGKIIVRSIIDKGSLGSQ